MEFLVPISLILLGVYVLNANIQPGDLWTTSPRSTSARRVSRFLLAIPFADRLFTKASFDVRQVFQIHAQGIAAVAANRRELTARDKAYTMSAELFLMQHTCHWFCRSRMVASARMMARHKTSYALLLDSVSPGTRLAYRQVVGN
jgi:hypothetical protein